MLTNCYWFVQSCGVLYCPTFQGLSFGWEIWNRGSVNPIIYIILETQMVHQINFDLLYLAVKLEVMFSTNKALGKEKETCFTFGNQNLSSMWRHMHWQQIRPPGGATWIGCKLGPYWLHHLVLSWYLHQLESHHWYQSSLKSSVIDIRIPDPWIEPHVYLGPIKNSE